MIKANHSLLAKSFFDIYIYRLLKKNFFSINLINNFPSVDYNYPVILAPNHSTWWDGFFAYIINDIHYRRKFYIMILEESLKKYKFFTKLGGFSINQKSPKSIFESINYTIDILQNEKNSFVTIFPQGVLQPYFINEYNLGSGLEKIIKNSNPKIELIFMSINIFYLNEEKPEVFFNFRKYDYQKEYFKIDDCKNIYNELINETKLNIINNQKGTIILSGKKSISEKSKNFFGLRK